MPGVRLIREVVSPGCNGPVNGQFALQRALRRRALSWLAIGGRLRDDEIPWFWCWLDAGRAARWAEAGRPLVVGPNVLFENSRRPCGRPEERTLCDAASCRVLFTESAWYRQLIETHRGPANQAPIVVWPYPIDPMPGGPLEVEHDLLIYAKSGLSRALLERLSGSFRRSVVLRYGGFRREELVETARRSRACLYLSDDDRGPLALAEILLCGCPAVGVPRGAPFIEHGQTGVMIDCFDEGRLIGAVEDCLELDRERVRALARGAFDTERIVDKVAGALRTMREI